MRTRTYRISMLIAALSLLTLTWTSTAAAGPADAAFRRTWERTDKPVADLVVNRTWMWGPAATSLTTEEYAEAPGGTRTVQYFEKSRMEDNSYRAMTSPWDVTNGLLVVELMTGNMQVGDNAFDYRAPALVNVAGDANDPSGPTYITFAGLRAATPYATGAVITQRVDRQGHVTVDSNLAAYQVTAARYVPETNHQVAAPFWSFMNSSGPVYEDGTFHSDQLFLNPFYATGYPLNEAYWATVLVGGTPREVLMQCFERRCLTYTPGNPVGWQVEAGNVGLHYYSWRHVSNETVWTRTAANLVDTASMSWVLVPDMELTVNVPVHGDLAATFSAETGGDGGTMFVRAVVDSQLASPSDVAFAVPASPQGGRSFTFSMHNVSAGSHVVRIEWRMNVGIIGAVAYRTLSVVLTPPTADLGALAVQTAPSGPPVTTTSSLWSWSPIPDMSTSIMTPMNSDLAITLSAESWTSGARMFARVLVDGQEADPWTKYVVFAWGGFAGTHAYTWTMDDIGAGAHTVVVEWVVDGATTGSMGDRTLTVSASPSNPAWGGLAVRTRDNDMVNTSSPNWSTVPDMSTSITTPANGVLAITLSAEGWTNSPTGRVVVRALVDGLIVAPPEAYFIVGDRLESHSFTFAAMNLSAGTHAVEMQWLPADGGTTGFLWNRSLTVVGRPVQ